MLWRRHCRTRSERLTTCAIWSLSASCIKIQEARPRCPPLPTPILPRNGVRKNAKEPNSRATPQGLDQRSKIARRKGSNAGQSGRVLDSANDVHRRCKKNSPFVLPCIGKRIKNWRLWPAWQRILDSLQRAKFGRASPLRKGNRKNIAEERVLRKISIRVGTFIAMLSPQSFCFIAMPPSCQHRN